MPLVTVTLQKDRGTEFTSGLLDAVHRSLVANGVPEADRFHRVLTLDEASFRFDAHYPDVASARTGEFVLIEILWSVGRSVKVKRKVATDIVDALARKPGLDPEQVMIVFIETAWENWAFAGGRLLHAG
jgi:phenylpyruvate tautomerase PptA (4-oxalocrotonate tautomerase family)